VSALRVALYEPEIPPNTGNIIRLCANVGAQLHLIEPLGFALDDKRLKRAGLDYREWADIHTHSSFANFQAALPSQSRLLACSTKGQHHYADINFKKNDVLLFGPETRGLPAELLANVAADNILRIPMQPHSRSLNLSNAVAVILYEAWRQLGFCGAL